MTLEAINQNNLISQIWQNIYELIKTIPDPKSRGTQWIFSAFPQQRKEVADVYPCIIIESPELSGENFIFGHSTRKYSWTIPISIYATRMETVDVLADSVLSTLESNKGSLETTGMYQLNFRASAAMHSIIAGNIIHEKRIDVEVEGVV